MKRRNFLSLLGAATIAPAIPTIGAPSAVTAATGYNRYMYGLAVFQARTRASVSAADLIARLRVSAVQADAMMGEMAARGVLSPALGTVRVASTATPPKPYIRKALRQLHEHLSQTAETPEITDAALRRCTGGAQGVHGCHPPAADDEPPTCRGSKL